ncbi:MAG: hypothetical protein ACM3UZ_16560 [Acidobacteriota bacterium]
MSKTLHSCDPRWLYRRWAAGAGPFALFVRKANFMSLAHYPDIEIIAPDADLGLIQEVMHILSAQDLDDGRTLNLLDVPGEVGLAMAGSLQNEMSIKPILIYPNLLHPFGAVGGDEMVRALVWYGEELTELEDPRGFALVLDSKRYIDEGELSPALYNNQYELGEDDLPKVGMLDSLGIEQIIMIRYHNKEDVGSYCDYLRESGINVREFMIGRQGGE